WAMANADALFSISESVSESLVETGYQPGKIHKLLNSIDLAAWDDNLDAQTAREELGLNAGDPVIVSVGRLFVAKGQGDLIRSLALVRRELPEVKLLLVGSDDLAASAGRGSYEAELRALVTELGLEPNVKFMGQRSDVAKLLAASDVFALPSFGEPFGLVFLEAMAMKKPVVALNNGGTPEVVDHGETGLLSSPGDIEALASNLLTLLRDPLLRTRMGQRGRHVVETRFTSERMARDAERLYESLTNRTLEESP
ncbi:MAG TPA: glycosyltransferase family 4 protein, partial [Dehalococcoidia bacterium]|nr:glycosyltransferase family 4 protein [Dehalococcoidia bacterium]